MESVQSGCCWKGALVVDLAELDVLAVAVDRNDVLYAATSPDGKVYKIENGAAKEFFDPKAKYIWSLVFDKQGRLLVGTGDKGIIYRVTPDGKGSPFYDTDETHIISMAVDRDGNLIAGGDPKGYIYRISPEGRPSYSTIPVCVRFTRLLWRRTARFTPQR
jgi:ligand-binding sensor domain-containing protein